MDIDLPIPPVTTVGIPMPSDFPQQSYEVIHRYCQPRIQSPGQKALWDEYMFAWNAVAYRFAAMAEYDEDFKISLSRTSFFDRYVQVNYSPKTGQGVKVDFRPAISQKEVWYDFEYEKDVRCGFQGQSGF